MRIRLLLQVGVKDKDADFYKLLTTNRAELANWALDQICDDPLTIKKEWKLATGEPHLIEFEAIKDLEV
jgi:hypothetical protein